ncbi:MAG: response regulator [bacterium]
MDKNKKILIIEDDANLLYGMQAKLSLEGFRIIADEGSGRTEIIGKIKFFKPDYIILDIVLPEDNGFDILAGIKSDPETKKIPVFIFTDLSDSESKQKGREFGADFYLIKSELNIDGLVEKFKSIIKNLK